MQLQKLLEYRHQMEEILQKAWFDNIEHFQFIHMLSLTH